MEVLSWLGAEHIQGYLPLCSSASILFQDPSLRVFPFFGDFEDGWGLIQVSAFGPPSHSPFFRFFFLVFFTLLSAVWLDTFRLKA